MKVRTAFFAAAIACGGRSTLDGDAGAPAVELSTASIDFGFVDCGGRAFPQTVSIANVGTAPFSFDATLARGSSSPFDIAPTSDVVAPGGVVLVVVTPKQVPTGADTTTDAYADDLSIHTSVPDDVTHHVALHQTAQGSTVAWSVSAVDYGKLLAGDLVTKLVTITNTGNHDATVHLDVGPPFWTPASVVVPAGGSFDVPVGYLPDPANLDTPASQALYVSVDGATCGALASSLPLSGTSYERAIAIAAAGVGHTCAVGHGGITYCWGSNGHGECGSLNNAGVLAVPQPSQAVPATGVAGTWASTCTLQKGGFVECFGEGTEGELGNGTTADSWTPVAAPGVFGVAKLVSGVQAQSFCAVRSAGQIVCWGANGSGHFGTGTVNTTFAYAVPAFQYVDDAIDFGIWGPAACVVRASGKVQCAGQGGMLGNGTSSTSYSPVDVVGITDATRIGHTEDSACALLGTGGVKCWGTNGSGELGNGSYASSNVPVDVQGPSDVIALAGGSAFMCAVRSGGGVVCWGANNGSLGNGLTVTSNVPVAVSGITNAIDVSAGYGHACALLADGTLRCWGRDDDGQLGNGQVGGSSLVPVKVVGFD